MDRLKKRKNQKGFTLVEIVVVLVILAILAAILVPSFVGWINKANEKTAIVDARSALMAIQTVASENYSTSPKAKWTSSDTSKAQNLAGLLKSGQKISKVTVSGGSVESFTYTDGKNTVNYTASGGFVANPETSDSSKMY